MKAVFSTVALLGFLGSAIAGDNQTFVPELVLVEVADGLSSPIAARHAGDGSGRLFILERAGRIRILDADGTLLATPFLDFSNDGLTQVTGEGGLLGIDFHPDYENNGLFFLNYTTPGVGATQIARYSVSAGDPNVADPNSGTVILSIPQDFSNHNGGDIHFGPDGFLYIGMGDGGSGNDPNDRAQDPQSLLGKMLRIDVDSTGVSSANACGDDSGGPTLYAIPPNNPFVGDDGICDETWALGLRNPFRFSFDRDTGDMFIGDVGQNAFEEVSFQPAASTGGENYGWDCLEGFQEVGPSAAVCEDTPPVVTDPILVYAHTSSPADSITGGYRYRGPVGDSRGIYYFGDIRRQELYAGTESGGAWTFSVFPQPYRTSDGGQLSQIPVVAFGEDEAGHVYVIDFGGTIYSIGSPDILFSSGLEN